MHPWTRGHQGLEDGALEDLLLTLSCSKSFSLVGSDAAGSWQKRPNPLLAQTRQKLGERAPEVSQGCPIEGLVNEESAPGVRSLLLGRVCQEPLFAREPDLVTQGRVLPGRVPQADKAASSSRRLTWSRMTQGESLENMNSRLSGHLTSTR